MRAMKNSLVCHLDDFDDLQIKQTCENDPPGAVDAREAKASSISSICIGFMGDINATKTGTNSEMTIH
jgi:hypothetical protein